ncbi:hypothetical protein KC361_g9399 [Hortaea werneckii]|nr:hypothetical protein KC361_g9399 [Hortaea werneckii]
MNHSHHDHTGMNHDQPICSTNMFFTWDTGNLCIVFPSWRITGTFSLILSLIAVMALTAAYEGICEASRRYETGLAEKTKDRTQNSAVTDEKKSELVKAAFYGLRVFYTFFIMLIFMTYNGWIMLAVSVGGFLGYLFFSG